MLNEKLILDYISIMEKVDTISYENYKKRNILLKKGFDLLKQITGNPINYENVFKILKLSKSNNVLLGIAGLIRFDNKELSKELYIKIGDKEPIVGLILKNWEKDNLNNKKIFDEENI
ncbi:MAG: hypothetical protein PHF46_04310 [Candidatus Gracilibacteria bacterium]|nr:hypothetical protein [Candidatus Gracilibacteria bacterium]MDD4530809.1 hypothetical protein [Candidatus Gracilibacteria bacterium]